MFRYQVLTLDILLIIGSGEGLRWGGNGEIREADKDLGSRGERRRSRMDRHGRGGSKEERSVV